jgi:hypothetical protein
MVTLATLGALIATLTVLPSYVPREHLNLSGTWQFVKVPSLEAGPPEQGWQAVEVPHTAAAWRFEAAWYRRFFAAPAAWEGKRVKLVLQGAKFCPVVFVNGQKVGEHFGGYEPAELDITAAVRPGAQNELLVGLHDWTALFRGEKVEFPEQIGWEALRAFPRDRVLYPMGGRYSELGLWDDVIAFAVPAVYLAHVAITTDLSQRALRVRYEIANDSPGPATVSLAAQVADEGRALTALPPRRVEVPAGKTVEFSVTVPWPRQAVTFWQPEHPKLYFLVSRLEGPAGVDQRRDRFGFREFTIRGHDFYLNGVKRHLLASSAWPLEARTREEVAEVLRQLRAANVLCFRTHTQPWRQIWYDVADEVGLLMIPEGAVWNDDETYRLDDPDFWHHWGQHLRGMVRALANHPSIVMWSLENEFCGWRARAGSVYEKRLADLGRLVKREDPSRPIYYESDGDPGGVADVIGLHYPNEPPNVRLWPAAAYWMDAPRHFDATWAFFPKPDWKWDRSKPLYIGEYLWWPGGTPASYTLLLGDEAYRDLHWARNHAKAAVWRWQTIAYRHYEVSGICPWTLVEGGPLDPRRNPLMAAQAYAMQPLAAYVREEIPRCYGRSQVVREVEIFNDLPAPVTATWRWELVAGSQRLAEGGMGLHLPPGDHRHATIELAAPEVRHPLSAVLRISILRDGRVAFSDEHPLTIYPLPHLTDPGVPLVLYDPPGATAKLLAAQGLKAQQVDKLEPPAPGAGRLLIVGEGALASAHISDASARWRMARQLRAFVASGGRVVVLRQPAYPASLLPAELDAQACSTLAFLQQPTHPLLAGLPADAAKFWAPDHVVTAGELLRPHTVGSVPLVVTGHADGISHCALLEVRCGHGLFLLCQMPLISRFAQEPMAAEILQRLLRYAAAYQAETSEVLVSGAAPDYQEKLRDLGLRCRFGAPAAAELEGVKVALLRGASAAEVQACLDWVRAGGRLLLDRPQPEAVAALGSAVGLSLRVAPYAGAALRLEGEHHLIAALAREDLYWVAQPPPGARGWGDRSLASQVAEGALALELKFQPLLNLGPADLQLEGSIVHREADYLVMASAGCARGRFTVPATGDYLVGVEARGTVCQGEWAMGAVAVDGQALGTVSTSDAWQLQTLPARLTAGEHEIEVRFINDAYAPPEDRNFYLRSVAVGPAPPGRVQLQPIAAGPTVAALTLGRGQVIVNFLRWDQQEHLQAQRFFASLLTALGADSLPFAALAYDLTSFTPMPDLAHYSTDRGYCYLGSSGWIEGQIEVPEDGQYSLAVEAAGTKAAGEYPEVVVSVDGKEVGTLHLTTEGWRVYRLPPLPLAAGRHKVRLLFANDYYRPPEDRNLMLRRLLVAAVE